MKTQLKTQLLTMAAIATAGSLSMTLPAQAGEGGMAAAAAFHLDASGNVTDIAVAAGIGKTSALAGAELNYTSVLTSTTFETSGEFGSTSESTSDYYGYGSSKSSSNSNYVTKNSETYQPVPNVKAFAIGTAGSLSYSFGLTYYGGPSIYAGGENPENVGTAQANTFSLNGLTPDLGLTP